MNEILRLTDEYYKSYKKSWNSFFIGHCMSAMGAQRTHDFISICCRTFRAHEAAFLHSTACYSKHTS